MMEKLRQKKARLLAAWWRLWDKVAARMPRMPRPWRVVRNLACIALSLCGIWLLLGQPAMTEDAAFHQAERTAMLGPSEVIARGKAGERSYIVGETDYGYLLGRTVRYGLLSGWGCTLRLYQEKGEKAMLIPLNSDRYGQSDIDLLLVGEVPGVSYGQAEITIAATGSLNGRDYEFQKTYAVSFTRGDDGLLYGRMKLETPDDGSFESELERCRIDDLYQQPCPVTIRLYGDEGELLYEDSFEYRYPEVF